MSPATVVKQRPAPPKGFYAAEAHGLRWLAAATADGGVRVVVPVEPVHEDSTRIVVPRIATRAGSAATAAAFGRQLAATHRSGAAWFGCPPAHWHGEGFIGPIPLPYNRCDPSMSWGEFYVRHRVRPYLEQAVQVGSVSAGTARAVHRLCDRIAASDPEVCGPAEPPARLHGDLWSGNVLWDDEGVVLIDPAAHGGHRETDLAMLALFGLPHLDDVLAAYHEAHPLADGWQHRVGVHQLFPVLVHAVLFGRGYGQQAQTIADRYR